MKHLKLFEEFYFGTSDVIGVTFKFKNPITLSNGKTFNNKDTWIVDKAEDDDHYCTNQKTGEKECFHTDIMLGDTIMDDSDRFKFC